MSIKQIHFLLFSSIVTVAVFSYLLTKVSLAEVWTLVCGLSWQWLVLFVLFSMAMSLFRTWRYQLVLNVSGYKARNLPLFLITLIRNFFSDLL
ncbi:MAG TPA: hypothetical protein VJ969_06805, partial [Desulfopila sp.]|nr:hypothetical protein [Desulfopila sp.]